MSMNPWAIVTSGIQKISSLNWAEALTRALYETWGYLNRSFIGAVVEKFSLRGYGINIVSRGRYPKRARYLMRKYGNPENVRMFWMREKKMQQPLPIKKLRDYVLIKKV